MRGSRAESGVHGQIGGEGWPPRASMRTPNFARLTQLSRFKHPLAKSAGMTSMFADHNRTACLAGAPPVGGESIALEPRCENSPKWGYSSVRRSCALPPGKSIKRPTKIVYLIDCTTMPWGAAESAACFAYCAYATSPTSDASDSAAFEVTRCLQGKDEFERA